MYVRGVTAPEAQNVEAWALIYGHDEVVTPVIDINLRLKIINEADANAKPTFIGRVVTITSYHHSYVKFKVVDEASSLDLFVPYRSACIPAWARIMRYLFVCFLHDDPITPEN